MHYDFITIPDEDVPQAADPLFQHLVVTYASETNKTASMWKAIPDNLLYYKPHEKVNTIRAILVHQILSERRFFAQFVGTKEPPVSGVSIRHGELLLWLGFLVWLSFVMVAVASQHVLG